MNKITVVAVLAAIVLSACNTTSPGNVTSFNAKGNLESNKPSGCVSITNLSNQQNPVDIFSGINKCIEQERYSQAAELYITAMSYGYFDTKRVSDKSAHQALNVLRMNVLSGQSEEVMDNLQVALEKISSNNTFICQNLSKLGAPSYLPTYMIQHGMGAFMGQSTKDGLVENFDSVTAWKESLSTVADCIQG